MRIGIPKEIKDGESRVALTPEAVGILAEDGHDVLVEAGAGGGCGFGDEAYRQARARIVDGAQEIFACEMLVKVKEVQPREYALLEPGRILVCFQQLARDPALLQAVLDARLTCIASESLRDEGGALAVLAPMSQIAGRLAPLIGAHWLQRQNGGSGVLLPGGSGVAGARVAVVGAGNVGYAAACVARALGCEVALFARRERLAGGLQVQRCTAAALAAAVAAADLLIGAVLEPGALSPKLITREMLRAMRPGSVFVDVGIDMGGMAETSRQTSFSAPTYVAEGVIHYCVPNIPASVPRTATLAYANAILPFVRKLAAAGLPAAMEGDAGLKAGLLTCDGNVVHEQLARDTGRAWRAYG